MSYRNKTYVAFASEDIHLYRMMEAWRDNDHIDFNFYDAHDLYVSRDTSMRETIKRNLRERLKNAKQIVLIGTRTTKSKGNDGYSFLDYEIKVMMEFGVPIVIANQGKDRTANSSFIPNQILDEKYHTLSVSFQPAIIQYALNEYPERFDSRERIGPRQYKPEVYTRLGL